jgi:hypothetical protein
MAAASPRDDKLLRCEMPAILCMMEANSNAGSILDYLCGNELSIKSWRPAPSLGGDRLLPGSGGHLVSHGIFNEYRTYY